MFRVSFSKISTGWDFSQRLNIRASTMLLFFSLLLVLLALSDSLYNLLLLLAPGLDDHMWRFGVNLDRYLAIAALLAAGFFCYSLYKKTPQLQFLLEILTCAILYLFL